MVGRICHRTPSVSLLSERMIGLAMVSASQGWEIQAKEHSISGLVVSVKLSSGERLGPPNQAFNGIVDSPK
jgi:hypothetical protein